MDSVAPEPVVQFTPPSAPLMVCRSNHNRRRPVRYSRHLQLTADSSKHSSSSRRRRPRRRTCLRRLCFRRPPRCRSRSVRWLNGRCGSWCPRACGRAAPRYAPDLAAYSRAPDLAAVGSRPRARRLPPPRPRAPHPRLLTFLFLDFFNSADMWGHVHVRKMAIFLVLFSFWILTA